MTQWRDEAHDHTEEDMMKHARRLTVIVAAAALAAAGCGSSSAGGKPTGSSGAGSQSSSGPASSPGSGGSQSSAGSPSSAGSEGAGSSETSGAPGSSDGGDESGAPPAAGSIKDSYDLSGASFTVGSKEFTESKILGEITIEALQAAGADVTDKTGISGSNTVRTALTSGAIDMYWEYTGTGWVNILGNSTKDVPSDLFAEVKKDDAANGVTWLPMAPFQDTYAIAVKTDWAKKNNITSLSEAAKYLKDNPDQATLCAASEFVNRDDGLPGLEKAYGITFDVTQLDLSLVYTQVGQKCNFGEVFSTDARIITQSLTVLKDDQGFFVPYNGALTVRTKVLDKNPKIADLMAPISKLLTNDTVTAMNKEVDVDGKKASAVAKEFLTKNGFIS